MNHPGQTKLNEIKGRSAQCQSFIQWGLRLQREKGETEMHADPTALAHQLSETQPYCQGKISFQTNDLS